MRSKIRDKIVDYLRIFRAQTAPVEVCVFLSGYLCKPDIIQINPLLLIPLIIIEHCFAYGHNSLMDTAMGYDIQDPHKKHHPLVAGRVSMHEAHNVLNWGLLILSTVFALLSFMAANPTMALFCLFLAMAGGYAYNCGLSKESLLSFVPIALYNSMFAGWAWYMTHYQLGKLGLAFVAYIFTVITFQIGWEGFLKDIKTGERSNLLRVLGCRVIRVIDLGDKKIKAVFEWLIIPPRAMTVALIMKLAQVVTSAYIVNVLRTASKLVWWAVVMLLSIILWWNMVMTREYDHEKDLKLMSFHEVLMFFLPLPIMTTWGIAVITMMGCLSWFMLMNRVLWGTGTHPKV